MKNFMIKMEGRSQLTKEQMKMVRGGELCAATIICSGENGLFVAQGYADCDDNSGGSDSDAICDGMESGSTSYSCEC